jgi:hypothetical protein
MANVVIDIAAEFTGKKAFKEAETATGKLTRTVKTLAGSFGLAFGTAALTRYGKAAVKAFAEDEAAAIRLTRAVDNLGIGFANPSIADYISELEKSAAVADDVLRPAFQSLLTTTGSLTQSQKLLNDAITISRASGIDLATVSQDLAKGYVGITKGLIKYNTGLTKAEIQSKSFSEILGVLLTQSAGAASDYLDSTAYSMEVLSIASGNASEIIGKGLVDAFARIGGGTEASDAAIAIEGIAGALAKITVATGTAIGGVTNVFKTLKNLPKNIFQGFAGAQTGVNLGKTQPKAPQLSLSEKQKNAALAKLEAAAAARAKKLEAAQKAATKAQQDALKLAKARAIFDLQQIQIQAALKGKLSEEDKIRLKLMQAIEEENLTNVEKYEKALEKAQEKAKELQEQLDKVKALEVKDPFSTWKVDPVAAAIGGLTNALTEVRTGMTSTGVAWSEVAAKIAATEVKPNLTGFKSSFQMASDEAESAVETAVTALGSTATAATAAAIAAAAALVAANNSNLTSTAATTTEAIGTSTTTATDTTVLAIAESGSATASTIVATSQAAADALDKLYEDSTTALSNASAATTTDFMATSSAALASLKDILNAQANDYAAAAAAASAQATADAADRAGAGTAGGGVNITVNTGVGDPNAIAEAIQQVLIDAGKRGTLDVLGID